MPETIANLSRMMGGNMPKVGLGIGMVEQKGHEGASCTHCGNTSDPRCGCLNYKWNSTALAKFVREAEAAGVPTHSSISILLPALFNYSVRFDFRHSSYVFGFSVQMRD